MGTVLIIFSILFIFGPLAKAYADRLTRDLPDGSGVKPEELARVKEEVERLSAEVARLHDEQSFMLRLLSEGDRKKLLEGRNSQA